VRTDVRVCNTSYLQTDWYINQMKRKAYFSEPLPISWNFKDYRQGTHDYIYIVKPENAKPLPIGTALNFVRSEDNRSKMAYGTSKIDFLPTDKLTLAIDSAEVVRNKAVNPEYDDAILNEMNIDLAGKDAITKLDAMMLDIVNTNRWQRPVYYAITVPGDIYRYYEKYVQKTGLATQVVPLDLTARDGMRVNTKKMYDNVMNKFQWGGLEKPGLYLDETTMRMCKGQRGTVFADLAQALIAENKPDSAIKVLDRCVQVFPKENVPYDRSAVAIMTLYLQLSQTEKAKEIGKEVLNYLFTNIDWYLRLKPSLRNQVAQETNEDLEMVRYVLTNLYQQDKEFAESYMDKFNSYHRQINPAQR